jgi:hypothetical protein
MLTISKIQNGLNWENEDRFFTNEYYENGHEIMDDIHILIELNNMIICLKSDSVTVDGIGPFSNSQDLINAIFS